MLCLETHKIASRVSGRSASADAIWPIYSLSLLRRASPSVGRCCSARKIVSVLTAQCTMCREPTVAVSGIQTTCARGRGGVWASQRRQSEPIQTVPVGVVHRLGQRLPWPRILRASQSLRIMDKESTQVRKLGRTFTCRLQSLQLYNFGNGP